MRTTIAETAPPAVTERACEEYHLYTLQRPTTVLDREIKQVEFVRASGVPAARVYVYDGFRVDPRYRGWDAHSIRTRPEYGTQSQPKVWVMLEFRPRVPAGGEAVVTYTVRYSW